MWFILCIGIVLVLVYIKDTSEFVSRRSVGDRQRYPYGNREGGGGGGGYRDSGGYSSQSRPYPPSGGGGGYPAPSRYPQQGGGYQQPMARGDFRRPYDSGYQSRREDVYPREGGYGGGYMR